MRFGSSDQEKKRKRWARRPPPNYMSRSVQGRVFLLVGALMLVLIAMQEARDPSYYQIFNRLQQGQLGGGQAEEVDTRLRSPDTWDGGQESLSPIVHAGNRDSSDWRAGSGWSSLAAEVYLNEGVDPLAAAWRAAWAVVLGGLESTQRSELDRALQSALQGTPPGNEPLFAGSGTLEALDRCWAAYLADAGKESEPNANTAAGEEGTGRDAADDSATRFVNELDRRWLAARAGLAALASEQPLTDDQRQALAQVQSAWDEASLRAIQDGTVFRSEEAGAWFRLLDRLQASPEQALEEASLGTVSFLALYRQPDEYRGKLVTVEGEIRQGKRVSAPQNDYGIDGYYVVWLKPAGSRSPIVIYCLQLPERFPLTGLPVDGEYVETDETVSVTGYFFKRWAYRAQDSTRLAPLILAKTLRWEPEPLAEQPASGSATNLQVWLLVLGTLLFGVCVSLLVYWTTRSRPASARASASEVRIEPAARQTP